MSKGPMIDARRRAVSATEWAGSGWYFMALDGGVGGPLQTAGPSFCDTQDAVDDLDIGGAISGPYETEADAARGLASVVGEHEWQPSERAELPS